VNEWHLPSPQQSSVPVGHSQELAMQVRPVGHEPQLSVPPQPLDSEPHVAPCAAHVVGTHAGQVVTVPLQVRVVAVTVQGSVVQVNTGPPGQSSSHCVTSWLAMLWFGSWTSLQPMNVASNPATSA
jgi:hypothetical protein